VRQALRLNALHILLLTSDMMSDLLEGRIAETTQLDRLDGFLEHDLVRRFAESIANDGLSISTGRRLQAFIAGHEVGLSGASQLGNTGAADLLMVTEDARWWIVEAKLSRSGECHPSFIYGNQLARYAEALERLGVEGLHPRLEAYLFGRRKALRPPESLAHRLEMARDLRCALAAWCEDRGNDDPHAESDRLLGMLAAQIRDRTITLAALLDEPDARHAAWVGENRGIRSLALLTVHNGKAIVACDGTFTLQPAGDAPPPRLPPFAMIPQSYKPTPDTLPRVLSSEAFGLYSRRLEPWLAAATDGAWPNVELSVITSAAFSIDLESASGRTVCLQIGRARVAGGGGAGEHPLKLIINLIWAAERAYEGWCADRELGDVAYSDLEALVVALCRNGGMLVRGIPRKHEPFGEEWSSRLREKMRGDAERRPELVAVREVGNMEGYGWPGTDTDADERMMDAALTAVSTWLGPRPYQAVKRGPTSRRVPGALR
jgi:hypothetical protein